MSSLIFGPASGYLTARYRILSTPKSRDRVSLVFLMAARGARTRAGTGLSGSFGSSRALTLKSNFLSFTLQTL